ncbi:MAG: HEAT repeat domain-containing protein [Candidatus Hydrogenedentales bacterium]|jgi:HEAT repeat protein
MAAQGRAKSVEIPASLLALLQSPDPQVRIRGIEGLAASETYESLQWLLLALNDPDPEVRKSAGQAVQSANPVWLVDSIVGGLLAGSPEVAASFDAALPSLGKTVEPTLLRLFRERGHTEQQLAVMAYALGRIKSSEAVKDLAKYARSDKPYLADVCADALYEVGDEGAIRELTGLVGSPFVEVRRTALYGLVRFGGPEVQAILLDVSSGKREANLHLRQEATALLAYVGDEKTVEYLVDLIRKQVGLGGAASFALQSITGYPVGNRPRLWVEWWNELEASKGGEETAPPLIPSDGSGPAPGIPPSGIPKITEDFEKP